MGNFSVGQMRNICFAGHGRAGKTTLLEAMLFHSGAIDRVGSVAEGTTTSDFDAEEIKRNFSISTSTANLEWKGCKINVIDTPGYFDFASGMLEGMCGADNVTILVSGKTGIGVGTENAVRQAVNKKLPISMFVTKLENEHSDYSGVLEQLKSRFGTAVIPFSYPIIENGKTLGMIDVVDKVAYMYDNFKCTKAEIPATMLDIVEDIRASLFEQIAETSEELLEKFFDGAEFTKEEIEIGIKNGIHDSIIIPVFAGELSCGAGIETYLNAICKYMESPEERGDILAADSKGEPVELKCNRDEPLAAVVFKTVADPYVGKLSLFRVFRGTLKADSTVYNSSKMKDERIGKLFFLKGKKQTETNEVGAGDIGAVTKLLVTATGDTLCAQGSDIVLDGIEYPNTVISFAVIPLTKGDEEKISTGLARLREEDPTFSIYNNTETHQMIISGQGEQHLEIIVSKLQSKYGVGVKLEAPIVAYREAIRGTAKVEGKHKKQSGGHGQYGHVVIEFEPSSSEGLEFCENVFGGSVPKNYFPAVEKGLVECMEHGVLAGYPVTGVKATLLDGSYHPVDSSEMAFKVAAGLAFKSGIAQAKPVLLEPIGFLQVTVPEGLLGDVIGDINKRRGRILGMGTGSVDAEVPMAEMVKYATDLRSMTQGRGQFTFEFVKYEEAAASVAQKVIEEAAKKKSE